MKIITQNQKEKIEKYLFYIILILLSIIMFFYIGKKEGFHEDEMFSYGSSNHAYDNLFHSYGEYDSANTILKEKVLTGNVTENIKYYMNNPSEFVSQIAQLDKTHRPVWRTNTEAKEYMTAKGNQFNYISVYYNQLRDVHPPLFYLLVNTVSSFVPNTFSKYIIFIINLVFFLGSCLIIKKIAKQLNKQHLIIPIILAYGLSMGAISTVMFQRMYMMLTFFVLTYLYLSIQLKKQEYQMDKSLKRKLSIVTILGFLTQYYFCIYIVSLAIVMTITMIRKKKWIELRKYLFTHIISAIIGIVLFPASIYHIFFSYRGVSSIGSNGYLEKIGEYINIIFGSFSITYFAYILLVVIGTATIYRYIKSKNKEIIQILLIPTVLFTLVIAKIAPYMELRYVMCILPIFAIGTLCGIDSYIKNKKISLAIVYAIVLITSIYGISMQKPLYLYQGYNDNIKIAEENKNLNYVYILDNDFNQIQSMPEFMIYKNSIILNVRKDELEILKEDTKIQEGNEFIISIKSYLDTKKTLEDVLKYTGYNQYTILNNGENDTGNKILKISK